MTDGTGTTRYSYAPVGTPGALQLGVEDGPYANDDISYSYDALGRLSGRSVAGSTEAVTYDALGRVSSGQNALGNLAFTYVGETRQVASESVGASARATYTYETNANDRRLKAIDNLGARGYQYTTNAQGVVTGITDSTFGPARAGAAVRRTPAQSRTWTPSYDAADRLLSMALSTGETYSYGYDAADNITSFTAPGGSTSASYGADNQLTAFGGANVSVDAAGNLLDDGKRTYQWDAAGHLATILYKAQPSLKTQFRYDGFGRRVAIVETSGNIVTETRYLWCGNVLCQSRDGSDTVTKRYFKEGEFQVASATKNFYNRDRIGSVRDVTGAGGTVVASFDFDPYGNLMKSAGTTTSTDFRYAGTFYHATSGLYLTWNRVYDPSSARWLSRDPIAELAGPNLYAYVLGNPVRYADPLGTAPGDKWYGYNDKNFQDWVHGQKQESGRGASENYDKEDLDELWEQWNEEGRPRGKGGKRGRGGRGRGSRDCDPEPEPEGDPAAEPDDSPSGNDNTALYVAGGALLIIGIGALIFFSGGAAAPALAFASDRRLKENLREVDNDEILRRLASMRVASWNYRSDGPDVRHIGPMSQDFKQTFSLGERETEIAVVDACGVLMASVQSLKRQLDDKSDQIAGLQQQLEHCMAELRRLEARDGRAPQEPNA